MKYRKLNTRKNRLWGIQTQAKNILGDRDFRPWLRRHVKTELQYDSILCALQTLASTELVEWYKEVEGNGT